MVGDAGKENDFSMRFLQVLSPDTKTKTRSVGRTRSKLLLHYNETKI